MAGMDTRDDAASATPRLGRYTIDTESSTIRFDTRHLFGLLPVHGTFAVRSGTVEVAEQVGESTLSVEVDAKSFHTGNDGRDNEVKSAKFLDTERHPVITFASGKIEGTKVTGTLTACGVDRPATLTVVELDSADDRFTTRATTRVDRTEFGVTAKPGMAGRHLDLTLEITCVRS